MADTNCPHDDVHRDPSTVPWGVRVGPERDSDGQPIRLYIEKSNGAHVAESDADWLSKLIRTGPRMIDTSRLTPLQLEAVQRTIRLRPDADWTVSPLPERHVQLLGIGRGYIWAVIVGPDGTVNDREAVLGPWKETIT